VTLEPERAIQEADGASLGLGRLALEAGRVAGT
jgi:hypothetical protein